MGAFSLIVVSYYIYIDIYIIMEGVVNVGTPENAGSLVENVGNVVEAPSRPSRPRLLDEPLLEEVRRPLRMTDGKRMGDDWPRLGRVHLRIWITSDVLWVW